MTQPRTSSSSVLSLVFFLSGSFFSNLLMADAFMTKAQYEDYSVGYQCAQLKFHDDLTKQEEVIIKLEQDFGITDDTFEAFDELIPVYERDNDLLDNIRNRVKKECA